MSDNKIVDNVVEQVLENLNAMGIIYLPKANQPLVQQTSFPTFTAEVVQPEQEVTNNHGVFHGSLATDSIVVSDDNDIVYANGGDDQIAGGNGNDILHGQLGNDIIFANQGDDMLYGGLGADLLNGGAGHDHIYGGDGADFITGDAGNDVITAGTDAGSFSFTDFTTIDTIAVNIFGTNTTEVDFGSADVIYSDQDRVFGGSGKDTFIYNTGDGVDTIMDFDITEDKLMLNINDATTLRFIDTLAGTWVSIDEDSGVMLEGINLTESTTINDILTENALIISAKADII
jgi:Ca2+-binding RTX toxin-like protein